MARLCCLYVLAAFFIIFAGCTGESVRVVLPDRHPANPSAAEAPFVPPPDPFAGIPLPGAPPEQRHDHHPSRMDDDMRMEDMRMDDDQEEHVNHGGHDGKGDRETEEGR